MLSSCNWAKIVNRNLAYNIFMKRLIIFGLAAYSISIGSFILILLIGFPIRYQGEILAASREFEIDSSLIASVIRAESGFQSDAISSKGAEGLMQVLPTTAAYINNKMSLGISEINLSDPQTNIRIGTAYLRYLMDRFGDIQTVLIAYNAGEGRVRGWLEESSETKDGRAVLRTSPYRATNAYVQRVLSGISMYRFRLKRIA